MGQQFRVAYEGRLADVDSVVVDLTGVTDLDSFALGMLLVLRTEAARNGATPSLTGRVTECGAFWSSRTSQRSSAWPDAAASLGERPAEPEAPSGSPT